MPNYKVNDRYFDISDDKVDLFEADFPDAQLSYQLNDGRTFNISASQRKDFLLDFPDAKEIGWGKKQEDPLKAKPMWGSSSYEENVAKTSDGLYYPSPLNEEGRAGYDPISTEERSRQEYEMLTQKLGRFNSTYGEFMDRYEAFENVAKKQTNEGGFAMDTEERRYINANSEDYRLRKQERDEINDRIARNSYFNQLRMSEADAASEIADGIENMIKQIDAEDPELAKLARARNMSATSPRGGFSGFTFAKRKEDVDEYQERIADLGAAERLYRKTSEIYGAPINDGNQVLKAFGEGVADRGDDLDFWTMGASAIADDLNTRQAFKKIQDKFGSVKQLEFMTDKELDELLTPSEQILISAFLDNLQAQATRMNNTSGGYKAGQGAADSAMFMAQFLLTGGIGEAATTGTQVHKNVVNWLGRKIGSMNNGIVKSVARGTAKLGVGTAESIGKALVMTPLMPHTYANIADKMMSFDDKGELMDVTDALLLGASDALIETWSESTGDFVNKVLGVPGKLAKGMTKKYIKNVPFDAWGHAMNAPMMKLLRKGGFNGFLGEMGEEFIGNAVRSFTIDPEAFKEFAKMENLLVTAGSFAPMTIFGLGTSSAQYGWQKRKLAKAQAAFEGILRNASYTDDQIKFAVDELLGSTDAHLTPERLVQNFTPLLQELAYNDRFSGNRTQALEAAVKFMWEIARYRAYDGVYHKLEQDQVRDMQAEILEGTGKEFWTTRLSSQAGSDGTAYETDEVRAVEFSDGRVAYVLGNDGTGNIVVYNDGKPGFFTEDQLNEGKANGTIVSDATMRLNDYLTQQVARVRLNAEEMRMFEERNDWTAQVRAKFPVGSTVELGTTEAPIEGIVRQLTADGAIVESTAGVSQLTWEELGHTIGIEVKPQTDAQIEEETINNLEIADLQRRREREKRRAQSSPEVEQRLAETQAVDQAANEGLEKPIPTKADGSVDQTTLWNESPARWAQWKTEQRQDGGAYASSYIQNAIGILEGQIATNEEAFLAEADFDAKDALEQTIAQQKQRLAELYDLSNQYAPAQIPAQEEAQEETQAEETKPVVMAERQKFDLDSEYQRRLSVARALMEKEMILKEYFDAISQGSMEAVVMNKQNYKKIMQNLGCSEEMIQEVTDAIKNAEETRQAVNALHANGKVFIIAEYNSSVENGRLSYVHERQHNITQRRQEYVQKILALGLGREELQKILMRLAHTDFYNDKSDEILADEIISSAMELGYTYDDFSVILSKFGVPTELIVILSEINDEQRNDYTLVNARRNQATDHYAGRSGGEDEGDQEQVSAGVLGSEGEGSLEDSQRGASTDEPGEGTTGEEVVEEPEEPQGPNFRVTKPEDNLSDETKKELADKDLVMEGGAIMSDDYAELKQALAYQTPIERNPDLDGLRFSYGTRKAHIANYKKHPEAEKRVVALLERFAERIAMSELVSGVVSTTTKHNYGAKEKGSYAGPLRTNEEYVITFDLDTTCPRTFQYLNLVGKIEKRIGRPLTQTECIQLIEMMRMYGQQIPCVYCYAENKRQALKDLYTRFMESRHAVISAKTDEEALPHMYGHNTGEAGNSNDPAVALAPAAYKVFQQWRSNPKGMYNPTIKMLWARYNNDRNSVLTLLDELYTSKKIDTDMTDERLATIVAKELGVTSKKASKVIEEIAGEWKWDTIEGKDHVDFTPVEEDDLGVNEKAFEVWRDMTSYAKSASSAKSVVRFTPYTDELKKVSQEDRDYINGMGGVRMHSTNDFRIDYVFDYFQFMADMALYKMFGHTYTKSPEFVRIFGNSGYKINMSIAAYQDENGKIRPNADEGFDWEEAKRLRALFPNAGIMLMATSDEQIQMALDSDWIDMVIPFHDSGLPRAVWYNMRLWQNYQSVQKEKFLNSTEKKIELKAAGVMVPKGANAEEIDELFNQTFDIPVLYNKKGKRLAPHFLPGPTIVDGNKIPGHNNDHQEYLRLCKKYGVKPRFAGMQVRDNSPEGGGRVIDITEHPRYMILVKETARTDTPQTPVQFNFDEPSEALDGKSPLEYAFYELEARAMTESELEGTQVDDIYKSLKKDQFGIADQFINTFIKHKNETGEEYPLDYLTPESRDWFLVQRKALEEAFKDVETIPYHRNEYDEQGNLVENVRARVTPQEETTGPIDLIEEAKKAVAKADAKKKNKKTKKSEVRMRITPEQDKAYMDAVNAGDMETAQRMVDEAAEAYGYTQKVFRVDAYSGNKNRYKNVFGGVFYAESLDYFDHSDTGYSRSGAKPFFLNTTGFFDPMNEMRNLIVNSWGDILGRESDFKKFDIEDETFEDRGQYNDGEEILVTSTDGLAIAAQRQGYKGVILRDIPQNDGKPFTEYAVFDSNNVKSADLVTYDDAGNVIPLSQRFNPENEDIRFRVRTDEQREKLFEDAKKEFGTTKNFNEAGYMLPDASLLDFSEKDFPGERSIDHRAIEGVIIENGNRYENRWEYLADFMNEGAIRLLPESAGINMIQAPTEEQRKKIFDFIYKYNGEVILEINDERLNSVVYMEYDRRTSPARIFRDIDGYFNEGIVPEQTSDLRFSIIGERGAMNDKTQEGLARLANLEVARQMESELNPDWSAKDDENALKIKVATGWERGADGLWRYEVEDLKSKPYSEWLHSKKKLRLKDVVEPNPIMDMYPEIGEISIKKGTAKKTWKAFYRHKAQEIELPFGALKYWEEIVEEYGKKYQETLDECRLYMEQSILHEVQHAIQYREGFALGAHWDSLLPEYKEKYQELQDKFAKLANEYNALYDYEKTSDYGYALRRKALWAKEDRDNYFNRYKLGMEGYMKVSGEAEARNVEERMKMPVEERRNSLLASTEDVARKDQIFIMEAVEDAESSIRFRMSNENQAIFVSNAAKAVEGIKQEKATPEQWLKMIEKAGGLKAGEDKWMGLSDWLKASDKKTLTKQEVLDFIKENMIQIEETHYSRDAEDDAASQHDFLEQRVDKRYKEILNGLQDIEDYDDRRLEAFKQFQEELGEYAEFVDLERYGVYLTFPYEDLDKHIDMAKAFGVEVNLDNPIHETRRAYTTKGLDNLHEIALTVPTIERWNVSDYIHFGDAGDGRAVAWIRFGETTLTEVVKKDYQPKNEIEQQIKDYIEWCMKDGESLDDCIGYAYNQMDADPEGTVGWTEEAVAAVANGMRGENTTKVLVIDEIQSKRHQEGRERGYIPTEAGKKKLEENYKKAKAAFDTFDEEMNQKYDDLVNMTEQEGEKYNALGKVYTDAYYEMTNPRYDSIPDAPFDKNWHELAMKRMLRYAAENGYDAIAWTKGEQQAERYSIGEVISSVEYSISPDGSTYYVYPKDKAGLRPSSIPTTFGSEKEIAEVYGKDIAVKIVADLSPIKEEAEKLTAQIDTVIQDLKEAEKIDNKSALVNELTEQYLDLANKRDKLWRKDFAMQVEGTRIGGEGMSGFYDKMLPAFMNKYGKKWGVKVEDINFPGLEGGLTMHSVPVTEEMKASVMEGQVMFRMRGENESAEEFAQSMIKDFKEKYDTKAIITTLDPTSKEQLAKFAGVPVKSISDEMLEQLLRDIEKEDKRAWINEDTHEIAIFVRESVVDGKMSELVLIHENIHDIIARNSDLLALGEYLWKNVEKGSKEYRYRREIPKRYSQDRWYTEMAAYVISEHMQDGTIRDLVRLLDLEHENMLNKLLNISGYGKERKERKAGSLWNVLRKRHSSKSSETSEREPGKPGNNRFRVTEIAPEVRAEMDVISATAIINGNYLKAPNGKDTKLTPEQWAMVRTKNFKSWFGDWENDPENASKVVDENGEPRVVYHGTTWNPLNEKPGKAVFDYDRVGDTFDNVDIDHNFFFTASEEAAKGYGTPVPVFLNIRKMSTHTIREAAFDGNPSILDAHEMLIEAHDFGSENDTVNEVENEDGARWTLKAVDDNEAQAKYEAEIREWESKHGEQIEERKKAILEEREKLRKEVDDIYGEAYERLGIKDDLNEMYAGRGVSWGAYNELSNDHKQLALTIVKPYFSFSLDKIADLKEKLDSNVKKDDRLANEYLRLVYNRQSLEGFPQYDSSLEKEKDYTDADLYALDNNTDIKSATDNTGEFSPTDPDIRFRVTPEMDEEYLTAVMNGDMETAQKMVDEVAEAWARDSKVRGGTYYNEQGSGPLRKMYHGTGDYGFYVFNTKPRNNNIGSHFGTEVAGKEFASRDGDKPGIYKVYLNIKNPFYTFDWFAQDDGYPVVVIDEIIDNMTDADARSKALELFEEMKKFPGMEWVTGDQDADLDEATNDHYLTNVSDHEAFYVLVREIIELAGYDGLSYDNDLEDRGERGPQIDYIALYPNQIKSAEPVTYDDEGYVIPLSQRFNSEKSDLRFRASENNPESDIRFSVRTKPAPTKVETAYKLFNVDENDEPHALFIDGANALGRYMWLDADSPLVKDLEKLEPGFTYLVDKDGNAVQKQYKNKQKSPSKAEVEEATANGSRYILVSQYANGKKSYHNWGINGSGQVSKFAMRPGWHLTDAPSARHIGKGRNPEIKQEAMYRKPNQKWFKVEYAADVDYHEEASANPTKDIQTHIPEDGWYSFKTNTNANDVNQNWIISGSIRILDPLTRDEVRRLNLEKGVPDDLDYEDEVNFRVTGTPTDEVVANGFNLSPAQTADLAGKIFASLPEDARKKITEGLRGNILGLQDAIMQIPARLAMKENWDDQDRAVADTVAEEMTKMAGEMTRPFSAPEALWILFNDLNNSTDLISEAQRSLVRRNLGFDSQTQEQINKAKDGVRFRAVGNASANATASLYNKGAVNVWTRLKETFTDMHASVEELVKSIEKRTKKKAEGFENILMALNQQSSKGLAMMESYERDYLKPMFDEIISIMKKTGLKYKDVVRYVILKHGLERNDKLAQRDARAHYQEIYDEIIAKIKSMDAAQKRTYLTNAQLRSSDAKAKLAQLQGVNTTGMTADQLDAHKKDLAKAKADVTKTDAELSKAQKIATMTEADAQDELDKIFDRIEKGKDSVYKELRKNDYSGISSMFYDQLGVNRKDYETEEEYQAALMDAKIDRFKTLEDVEIEAETEVAFYEKAFNPTELWKRINAATKKTLRQQYEANMISQDQYKNLRDMFEYYVPLRGFADNTAEDMYTYFRKPNSTGYVKPILGAEGRKTEAESPFGWIASMAGSAIASNVKNEAKLALYYFVANRPDNGVATLSKTWFVLSGVDPNTGKKVFVPAYPPFTEDLSTASGKAQYETWLAGMEQLRSEGKAYEAGQRLNLGNSVVNISDANKPEHIVNVKVAGKDYTIVINGNPRAAQAINGDLNIETVGDYSTVFGPILRWMSSVNTSYNPEFWITNMQRDMLFTFMAVNAKEDPAYRRKFKKNYAKAFKVVSMNAKNEKGTIGNDYLERMYKDFVANGGVTGYTQIKDSEVWEKEIEKYIKSNNPTDVLEGNMMKKIKGGLHAFHRFGESLEQVSRFAAFLTSREMGKSMTEAINDAKEITVNFNRKGSGKRITFEETKYLTKKRGQRLNGVERLLVAGLSSIAPLGRRTIMFFNAAIQGLNAMYKLCKNNPSKMAGWSLGYLALGAMQALVHGLLDDDDDYLDIPEYERRNSLLLGANGYYFKWALPQEARAFYAMGDLVVTALKGRYPQGALDEGGVLRQAFNIVGEVLPINPSEGWRAFVPSVLLPFVEIAINEDYKGSPIYNEQKWLSDDERARVAKWETAYQGTGKIYVNISKVLNNLTDNSDLDEAGLINIHPEMMQHIVQSAFGGTIRTMDKFFNTISAALDPNEPVTVRQTPFLNRLLTVNDERYKNVHVNQVFDYYEAEAKYAQTLLRQYQKEKDSAGEARVKETEEFKWYEIYMKHRSALVQIEEKIRSAEGSAERKDLMQQQDEIKRQVIKEISEL